jgi:MATE family multidrug resistance protein
MIIANISTPLLGLVDTAVMGHLANANFLAAVALAGLIFSFLFWGFGFLRMGTTGLSAQAFGANNGLELKAILTRALLLALVIALTILVAHPAIAQLSFYLINSQQLIEQLAQQYFFIRIWSAPAILCQYVMVGWFLGMQNTRAPLLIVLTTNLANIGFDLLFVVYYDMDTDGVALASLLAEYLGLLVGSIILSKKLPPSPPLSLKLILQFDKIRAMLLINSYLFVRTLCLIFTFSFFTIQSEKLGTVILAANTVLLNFQTFMAYALDGFAHAAEALIGRAIGANNKQLFRQSIKTTSLWAALIALLFSLIYAYTGQNIINTLTHLNDVRQQAYLYLPWLVVLPVISVCSYLMDGIFIGANLSKQMRNTIIFALFVVFLPSWYYSQFLGNHGLWLALTAFMLLRSLLMFVYYLYYQRNILHQMQS